MYNQIAPAGTRGEGYRACIDAAVRSSTKERFTSGV
jgi:hypothetical protein